MPVYITADTCPECRTPKGAKGGFIWECEPCKTRREHLEIMREAEAEAKVNLRRAEKKL